MADQKTLPDHGRFDTNAIASSLPDVANTLLIDHYMTDGDAASTRESFVSIAKLLRITMPRATNIYLCFPGGELSGWAILPMAAGLGQDTSSSSSVERYTHFQRSWKEPLVFVSIDAPCRDPKDIIFENPQDGTPESFIQQR